MSEQIVSRSELREVGVQNFTRDQILAGEYITVTDLEDDESFGYVEDEIYCKLLGGDWWPRTPQIATVLKGYADRLMLNNGTADIIYHRSNDSIEAHWQADVRQRNVGRLATGQVTVIYRTKSKGFEVMRHARNHIHIPNPRVAPRRLEILQRHNNNARIS